MGFFKKFKRKSRGKKLEDLVVKKQEMEEKAKEMEYRAEMRSGIKKAKRKIYESSPAFAAIDKIQQGARAYAKKMPRQSGGFNIGGDLGMGGDMDIFGSNRGYDDGYKQPKKKSKKKRNKKFKKNRNYRREPMDWF